jgi:hypothetical protein
VTFDPVIVEQQPVAEVLPGLYRAVLDAVGALEARGHRREAAKIREEATAAYSKAWNEAAARRLRSLRARADRIAEGRRGPGRPAAVEAIEGRIDLGRTTV